MMQTTAGEIFEFLKLMAPLELQMDFDNAGFLVGDRGRRVEKALLALDATSEVIGQLLHRDRCAAEGLCSNGVVVFFVAGGLRFDKIKDLAKALLR